MQKNRAKLFFKLPILQGFTFKTLKRPIFSKKSYEIFFDF